MITKDYDALIAKWRGDIDGFVWDNVGITLDPQQSKITKQLQRLVACKDNGSIYQPEADRAFAKKVGIAIDSGRGIGKTALMALVILWFMTCFKNALVIATAPKKELLKDNLWGELSKWMQRAREHAKAENGGVECLTIFDLLFELQTDKLYNKALPNKNDRGKKWVTIARTANRNASEEDQKATISGYHEDYLLIVVDESYGVNNAIYEPLDYTLTGRVNLMIMIGNPTKNYGFARDAHTKSCESWIPMRMNAEESTLVDANYLERQLIKARGSKDSNVYRINVLGLPPKSDTNALIAYEWLEEAIERWEDFDPADLDDKCSNIVGGDVGGGGDLSVLCHRQGGYVYPLVMNSNPDTMMTTGWMERIIKDIDPDHVIIDATGIGAGVASRLRELGTRGIVAAMMKRKSSHSERYGMVRDEIFWKMRLSFERGWLMIPRDENLIAELSMLKLEQSDSSGVIRITGKAKMRQLNQGFASPNHADALALTFLPNESVLSGKGLSDPWEQAHRVQQMRQRINECSWMA